MTSSTLTDDVLLHHLAHQLLHTYARLVDAQDLDGLATITHPDVVLTRHDGTREGREAFLDLYRQFAASDVHRSQHMVTNVVATRGADGVVHVASTFLAFTEHDAGGARLTWGRYDDDMVEHEGRWVFAAKRIRIARTVLVDEAMLAPLTLDSFGPIARA
ncbi:nuclear transport factor 2 family protein [Georgenia sp. AZ-5]|uniref:nuclear transport factor 2 family protein n=1 Tax=Georgenia sp. AZ-5 TaxID=3367526 RepID=UPI003754A804